VIPGGAYRRCQVHSFASGYPGTSAISLATLVPWSIFSPNVSHMTPMALRVAFCSVNNLLTGLLQDASNYNCNYPRLALAGSPKLIGHASCFKAQLPRQGEFTLFGTTTFMNGLAWPVGKDLSSLPDSGHKFRVLCDAMRTESLHVLVIREQNATLRLISSWQIADAIYIVFKYI
jgi:hypothetical protein